MFKRQILHSGPVCLPALAARVAGRFPAPLPQHKELQQWALGLRVAINQHALLQGEPPVLDLPLPEVDAANAVVACDDQVCHADAAARTLPDEAWRRLEAPLLPGMLRV